jgi:chemotaxis signal transduction protein
MNTRYPLVRMTQLPQALAYMQGLQNLKEANIIILDIALSILIPTEVKHVH